MDADHYRSATIERCKTGFLDDAWVGFHAAKLLATPEVPDVLGDALDIFSDRLGIDIFPLNCGREPISTAWHCRRKRVRNLRAAAVSSLWRRTEATAQKIAHPLRRFARLKAAATNSKSTATDHYCGSPTRKRRREILHPLSRIQDDDVIGVHAFIILPGWIGLVFRGNTRRCVAGLLPGLPWAPSSGCVWLW